MDPAMEAMEAYMKSLEDLKIVKPDIETWTAEKQNQ